MRTKQLVWIAAVGAVAACGNAGNPGGPVAGTAADSAAIRAIANTYALVFSKHDANILAPVIADDYQDVDATGKVTQGHDAAIKAMQASLPPDTGMTMTATTTYIRFLTPTAAIAGGTWNATSPNMPPSRGAWMAAAVKKDSTWKSISTLAANDDSALMAMAASMPKTGKKKTM